MMLYLKYGSFLDLNEASTFQFSTATEAKAHIKNNFRDCVWIAAAQEPLKDGEDGPDFFAYDSIEAAYDAINEAHIEMNGGC